MCPIIQRLSAVLLALSVTASPLAAAGADMRLLDAVKAGEMVTARALLKQGAAVNVNRADGMTPLHWAVSSGDAEIVELLLQSRAQVNSADSYGVTPLSIACSIRG